MFPGSFIVPGDTVDMTSSRYGHQAKSEITRLHISSRTRIEVRYHEEVGRRERGRVGKEEEKRQEKKGEGKEMGMTRE